MCLANAAYEPLASIDSIKVTKQYYFDYWKVVFFQADDLPLRMSIEKKLKRVSYISVCGKCGKTSF